MFETCNQMRDQINWQGHNVRSIFVVLSYVKGYGNRHRCPCCDQSASESRPERLCFASSSDTQTRWKSCRERGAEWMSARPFAGNYRGMHSQTKTCALACLITTTTTHAIRIIKLPQLLRTLRRLLHTHNSAFRRIGPVSRIEFTLKSSVYWPIIGLGTRTWSVAMRCRDPAGQSEFFVRVLHLKTFNWMYCYREFIVGIVVSAIAVFRLVDNILSSSLHC